MTTAKLSVLYIAGYGRSGSTLVERVLGQLDGFCAVGELRHIWDRSMRENQLCGCGAPFRDCDFWRAVTARAFGGFERIDADHMVRLKYGVDRTRHIPRLLLPPAGAFGRRLAEYADAATRLYEAIQAVSGCRVIIDSSKEPSYGFFLRRLARVDLHVLHLVRDSRAVAFSWSKKKERPEIYWTRAFMDRHLPLRASLLWTTFNSLCHGLAALGCRYRRVHYEDFVADPSAVLRPLLAAYGVGDAPLGFVRGQTMTLAPNHTVSGNPMRFAVGDVAVRLDREWRAAMPPLHRRAVTALTLPHLFAYGYLGGARGEPRPAAASSPVPAPGGSGGDGALPSPVSRLSSRR